MRVRGVLGFAFGLAAATALASCGGAGFQGGGDGAKARHGSRPPKHDMVVIIWLDSNCKAQKADPSIGYDDHAVAFEFRGACTKSDTLTLMADDGLTDTCSPDPKKCQVAIQNGMGDLTIHITKGAYGDYNYSFSGPVLGTLDPDLEIDP